MMQNFVSFLVAVAAGVVCHLISKGVELGRTEKMDKGKLLKKTVITAFVHFLCALVFCKKTGLFKIMGRS